VVKPPPRRRTPARLDEAAAMLGKTPPQVLDMLAERGGQAVGRPWDIPAPASDEPAWDWLELTLWAYRMGMHVDGHRGVAVIGYTGLALMVGLEEQSLRKLATVRQERIRAEGRPRPKDLPIPIVVIRRHPIDVALFASDEAHQWAMQTGRLHADGVTPRLLRPHTRR
jgi:hypothetical protein